MKEIKKIKRIISSVLCGIMIIASLSGFDVYAEAESGTANAPTFPEQSYISVAELSTNNLTISFPKGENDNGFSYRVQVINQKTQQQIQDYQYDSGNGVIKEEAVITSIDGLAADTKYTINAYCISTSGTQSEPLTRTIRTKRIRETITKYVGESTGSGSISKWGDGTGAGGWQFAAGVSIAYTFEIANAGKYELATVVNSVSGGTLAVQVDGIAYDSITVSTEKNAVTAGYYYMEAGTHTVKFIAETGSSYITMWSASLAKEEVASVTTVQASEKTWFSADYGHANDVGHLAYWGGNGGTVARFNVNIPANGTYDIYVDSGSSGDGNSWSAVIENQTVTSDALKNTGALGSYVRQKIGSVELTEGTQALAMNLNYNAGYIGLHQILFVHEGEFIIEEPETEEPEIEEIITKYVGESTGSGGYISKWGDGTEGQGGWQFKDGVTIAYTFEVANSGKYELATVVNSVSGAGLTVQVDGIAYDSITVSTEKNAVTAGYYYMEAGTHTVKFIAETGSSYITMWSASLAKEEVASVTTVQASEKTWFSADYGHANDVGHLAYWGGNGGTVARFNVNIPANGTYDIYVDSGSSGDGNSWSAVIENQTVTSDALKNTGALGSYVRQKIGSVELTKGTQALAMNLNYSAGYIGLHQILFVHEGEFIAEEVLIKYVSESSNASGSISKWGDGTGAGGWQFGAGVSIEYTFEIANSGIYELATYVNSTAGGNLSVKVDGMLYDSITVSTEKESVSAGTYFLATGTHTVVFTSEEGASYITMWNATLTKKKDAESYALHIDANDYDSADTTGDFSETTSGVVLGSAANWVEYEVDVPAGNYVLSMKYGRANGDGELQLIVNGESTGNIDMPLAGGYLNNYVSKNLGVLSLNEGVNTIRIKRGNNWFTFGSLMLEEITRPVSELYNGDYIIADTEIGEEFSGSIDGDMIFRTYLPASMKGQNVQLIGGIYEGSSLVKTVWSEPVMADENAIVITRMKELSLGEATTYTWKVLDYVRYTSEDAGIMDGNGNANGTLLDIAGTEIVGLGYDKTTFGMKLIFENTNAVLKYASDIEIALLDTGSLGIMLGAEEIEATPEQFGFATFQGQVFELSITIDMTTDTTEDTATVGIWIDKQLANDTYYMISNPEAVLDSNINFTNQGIERYSLWELAKPNMDRVEYVELQGNESYIVAYDTFTNVDTGLTYTEGECVSIVGEYTATVCGMNYTVVLWKNYDFNEDSKMDVKDLIAMKKIVNGVKTLPDTKAGYMAVVQCDSAYEIVDIRQELVDFDVAKVY